MQSEDPRHRRRWRTPRAPQSEHEGGDRRKWMTIDRSQVNGAARPTARTENVQQRGSRDQGGPDRRRPQNVAAGGKLIVPALDDALRFGARGSVGNLPLGRWRTPLSQCEIFTILRMIASDRIDRSPFGSLFRQEVRPGRRGPSRRAWRWRLRSAAGRAPFFDALKLEQN